MRKMIWLTAIMLLIPAVSQAKTLEELLVEKGVITQGEAKAAASAPGTVVYNKGVRWDFSDKKFSGQINTMLHTRYTFNDHDTDANSSSFNVEQARIIASGTVLDKEFTYKVEGDLVGHGGSPIMKDAYFSWHACDWMDLRMGQWKTGVSRQYTTSEQNMQFPDRSVASDYFDLGRQNGLMGSFKATDLPLSLSAAMYNGSSDGEGQNLPGNDTRHTAVLNARWDAMGSMNAYEEGDIDGTEDAALNLGLAYAYADNATAGDFVHQNSVNVDVNFKWQGWAAHAEYYVQDNDYKAADSSVTPQGFYAQVGYFVMPGEFEVAARYSFVDCDDGAAAGECSGNDQVQGVDVSGNYFFWKHQLKAQLAYEHTSSDPIGADTDNSNVNKVVFQLAGYF